MTADLQVTRERVTINRLAWEVALDRLELDIVMVERLLRQMDPPSLDRWDVPEIDGPIPADLLPRALGLQQRQAACLEAVREGLTSTRRHRAFTDRVSSTTAHGLISTAYVDLTA